MTSLPHQVLNLEEVVDRKLLFDVKTAHIGPCSGYLSIVANLKFTIGCPMNFRKFPFDVQMCPFVIVMPDYDKPSDGQALSA